jgi:ATP-dependent DNA helicase RecG
MPLKSGFAAAALVGTMAEAYLKTGQTAEAEGVLDEMPPVLSGQEAMDAAIIERRLGREKQAYGYFLQAGEMVYGDVKALQEFAQNKMKLTKPLSRPPFSQEKNRTRIRLLKEAETLLDRVVQLDAPPTRRAWAWYHLGQVRAWLKKPLNEVIAAYDSAVKLNAEEKQFKQALNRYR